MLVEDKVRHHAGLPVARRVNVRLEDNLYELFRELSETEGINMSDRLAALADLWATDPEVRRKGDQRAREVAAASRRRRYGGG